MRYIAAFSTLYFRAPTWIRTRIHRLRVAYTSQLYYTPFRNSLTISIQFLGFLKHSIQGILNSFQPFSNRSLSFSASLSFCALSVWHKFYSGWSRTRTYMPRRERLYRPLSQPIAQSTQNFRWFTRVPTSQWATTFALQGYLLLRFQMRAPLSYKFFQLVRVSCPSIFMDLAGLGPATHTYQYIKLFQLCKYHF